MCLLRSFRRDLHSLKLRSDLPRYRIQRPQDELKHFSSSSHASNINTRRENSKSLLWRSKFDRLQKSETDINSRRTQICERIGRSSSIYSLSLSLSLSLSFSHSLSIHSDGIYKQAVIRNRCKICGPLRNSISLPPSPFRLPLLNTKNNLAASVEDAGFIPKSGLKRGVCLLAASIV